MNKLYYLIEKGSTKDDIDLDGFYLINGKVVKYLTTERNKKSLELVESKYRKSFELEENQELLDALFKNVKKYSQHDNWRDRHSIIPATSISGQYFSRVFKPTIGFHENIDDIGSYTRLMPHNVSELISSVNQLSVLSQSLTLLFQTVQPDKINYKVYGHNIRNLLILTCTEVEAQLKGIFKSISMNEKDRYTTNDYIKLCGILKLKEYSVNLGFFPLDEDINPFANWNDDSPTKSLEWYDNYNAVKHDRENEFDKATLWNVIQAISGLAILLISQFGKNMPNWNEQIGGYFIFKSRPTWNKEEWYLPPLEKEDWERKLIDI
jgi:hypothetical protein